ncbi:MAG: PTS sugar transporter subunit IIB [Lachnospiraceae bacterium]
MANILLICTAGMSTSMIVKKMEAAAATRGIEAKIWAVGDALAKDNIPNADVIMLGPQVKFLLKKTQDLAGDKPVLVIDIRDYGLMNGDAILTQALDAVK